MVQRMSECLLVGRDSQGQPRVVSLSDLTVELVQAPKAVEDLRTALERLAKAEEALKFYAEGGEGNATAAKVLKNMR